MNDPDRSGPANGHGDDRASRLSAAILRISLSLDLATHGRIGNSDGPFRNPMTRHRTLIRLSAALSGVALVWVCGGDSPTVPPAPEPARPTTVTVSPATAELTALGATVQLTAEVRDQNARVMAGATVTWTSSANSVATVDASGLVTAAGNGTATITASSGDASGSAAVTITVINTDRAALMALYEATGGPDWNFSRNWLTDAPLREWYGVGINSYGRVRSIQLTDNNLTGSLPPELSRLTEMFFLSLYSNEITGPIPPELGNLSDLGYFVLSSNNLTGPIPPEFGGLANLQTLELAGNDLTGPIPPTLGRLTKLTYLDVAYNDLTGTVPPELAGMTSLESMLLTNNAGLRGALPASLTSLRQLRQLRAEGTELCATFDASFLGWLNGLDEALVATCASPGWSDAYLTQAVQSAVFPVPLVAGEEALLRVFVRATHATSEGIPPVRARFYLSGAERLVVDIANQSTVIPTEVDEGDLAKSANAEISGDIVQPGLEMVVEIDPDNTLDPGLLAVKRIPETGRMAVDVQAMPPLDLTLIPFLWASAPDLSVLDITTGMAEDPENHELLWGIRTLTPVAGLEVDAHEHVVSTSNETSALLQQVEMIRVMEGGTGHYMGTMAGYITGAGGVAYTPGRSSFAVPRWWEMAHELGHNMKLYHAPCGVYESCLLVSLPRRFDRQMGIRFPRWRCAGGALHAGHDGLLFASVDQRLQLHQCATLPAAGRRGCQHDKRRRSGDVPPPVGR